MHAHPRHSAGELKGQGSPECSEENGNPVFPPKTAVAAAGLREQTGKQPRWAGWLGLRGPPGQGCLRIAGALGSVMLAVFTSSEWDYFEPC